MTRTGGTLAIRSTLAPEALASAVRAAAPRVTPRMKVSGVTLQSTLVTNTMLREPSASRSPPWVCTVS
jgi:hypothetical protein